MQVKTGLQTGRRAEIQQLQVVVSGGEVPALVDGGVKMWVQAEGWSRPWAGGTCLWMSFWPRWCSCFVWAGGGETRGIRVTGRRARARGERPCERGETYLGEGVERKEGG